MRPSTKLLAFATVCAVSPFVMAPVTVIDVSGASTEDVEVQGWLLTEDGESREGLESRTTPFRVVVRGSEVEARFVTEGGADRLQVRAVRKRAWIPVVRVAGDGRSVSVEGSDNHLGLRAQ